MVLTQKILQLCRETETITSVLAKNPTSSPGEVLKKLYSNAPHKSEHAEIDLENLAASAKFQGTPSNLFLQIYKDVLGTLEHDAFANLCSPPLIGSSGVIPLTIISTIPDIMRHYANLIVAAEKEVFLATNYWINSEATKFVCDALRELSKRVGERGGPKVVVKLIYDRGNIKQALNPHLSVPESEFTSKAVNLPPAADIPNLEMEVQNYHQPMLGTFHSKYMVVDRKVACLNSNNIQDNANLEMMVHLEGPIVDSFYDMAMVSWHNELKPPLPLLNHPIPSTQTHDWNNDKTAKSDGQYSASIAQETAKIQDRLLKDGNPSLAAVTETLNHTFQPDTKATGSEADLDPPFSPYLLHKPHAHLPIAMVNRKPYGTPNNNSLYTPQNEAWLSGLRNATKNVFIQTPTFNAKPVVQATMDAIKRGIEVTLYADIGYNDTGELLPAQGGTNEMVVHEMYSKLSTEEKSRFLVYWYTAKDMNRPINAKVKKRDCHIKLMIIDDEIGIQGNGNQDTQSWFHSQEINVMIDSTEICSDWRQSIESNQNTRKYGRVNPETGVWGDKDGNPVEDSIGIDPGRFSWLRGVRGAIQRVQGTGNF